MSAHFKYRIELYGMLRSGNHYIADWIQSCLPKQTTRIINFNESFGTLNSKTVHQIRKFNRYKCLFISFENLPYREIVTGQLPVLFTRIPSDELFGTADVIVRLGVIRDYLNVMASFYQKVQRTRHHDLDIRDLWFDHATHINNEMIAWIRYNQFVTNQQYRQNICDLFDGKYNETTLSQVATAWGGSSFDQLNFDGQANQMDLFNRYKHFTSDQQFLNWFVTSEKGQRALQLSEQLFDIKYQL